MPISAPLTVAEKIFSRSVGTPAHSAAISSSRIAARPASDPRGLDRARDDQRQRAISTIAENSSCM